MPSRARSNREHPKRARPTMTPVPCPACRSKVDPVRERCPRCQSPLEKARGQDSHSSRRLGQIAAGLVTVFLIGWPGLYLARPGPGIGVDSPPPDPLAARRSVPDAPVAEPVTRDTTESLPRPAAFEPIGELPRDSADDDVEHALARLTVAIDERPADAEAHSALGELLVNLSRTQEALPYLRAAVELNPARSAYHLALARGLAHLQQWDEARASYRAALTLAPDEATITSELAQLLTRDFAGVNSQLPTPNAQTERLDADR
jgi:tetratricopeptide (TPR) repeat protein